MESSIPFLGLCLIAIPIYFLFRFRRLRVKRPGLKTIPIVSGGLPFLGHVFQLHQNCTSFLDKCSAKYGQVFIIKLGLRKLAVVASRELGTLYVNSEETDFSTLKLIQETGLRYLFIKEDSPVAEIINRFIRSSILSKRKGYLAHMKQLMEQELNKFTAEFEPGKARTIDLAQLVYGTVQRPVLQSLLGSEPTPAMISTLNRHIVIGRRCTIASYFLPRFLQPLMISAFIHPSRRKTIKEFLPAIQKEVPSSFLEGAGDQNWKDIGGRRISDEEICGVLLVTYNSMEGVGDVITQTIKELSQRPNLWIQLREELQNCQTLEAILEHQLLKACILEGARVNANMMGLHRGVRPTSSLGQYDFSTADFICLSGSVILQDLQAEVFDVHEYWPERFLNGKDPGCMSRNSFWFWGAAMHSCPGRDISIQLLQVYFAKFIQEFDTQLVFASHKNHICLDSVGNQTVLAKFTPINSNT